MFGALTQTALRPYRWRIALTYLAMLLENGLQLLYPFAIGLAINGLLRGEGQQALLLLAGLWLAQITVGAWRQRYDTRLFSRLYTDLATTLVSRQRRRGASTAEVSARTGMARSLVDLFEVQVPVATDLLVGLIGGVAMLYFYDPLAGAVMLALLLPIAWLYRRYGRRSLQITRRLNDRLEREVDIVAEAQPPRTRAHFTALARWRIGLSDAQVAAWSRAELLTLIAVIVVLLILTRHGQTQAGDIFAAFAYVLGILECLWRLPELTHEMALAVDIHRRVEAPAEAPLTAAPRALTSAPRRPTVHGSSHARPRTIHAQARRPITTGHGYRRRLESPPSGSAG